MNLCNRKKSQLNEEHKDNLKQYYDENPCTTIQDAISHLTESSGGFNLKSTTVGKIISNECNFSIKKPTRHPRAINDDIRKNERFKWFQLVKKSYMDYLSNCVFVDEAGFDIDMIPRTARSDRGKLAIAKSPTTKAISHTALGAISATGVISADMRLPSQTKRVKIDGARKQKATETKKKPTEGTKGGHFMKFITMVLDNMDKISAMKVFYFVMDNCRIHKGDGVLELIIN